MDRVIMVGKTYRHFKGKKYKVLCVALDSETNEEVVVYEALYGKHLIWTMPMHRFNSVINDEIASNKQTFRFELVN